MTEPDPKHSSAPIADAEQIDLGVVDRIVETLGRTPEAAIPILQAIQAEFRYLPKSALRRVCEISEITPAQIAGVSTFYTQFRHRPAGVHLVRICHGTACHVKGASLVHDALLRHLGITDEGDTDREGVFTVERVACLGCCTLAPVMQIDGITYGHLTPDLVGQVLRDFLDFESVREAAKDRFARPRADKGHAEIRVGLGSCCVAGGSAKVHEALERAVAALGLDIRVKPVGCVGMCHLTPLVEVVTGEGRSHLYARVQPDDAGAIVLQHFSPRGLTRKLTAWTARLLDRLYEQTEQIPRYSVEVRDPPVEAFLGRQVHIATEHCGHLDPLDFDEYVAHDGFVALARCLRELSLEELIAQVQASGLRGRGGAGFPTGLKWMHVRHAPGETKYVICNGDEGDPARSWTACSSKVILTVSSRG